MKLGFVGGLAGLGLLAFMGVSQAAVLTINLDNYDSSVDSTPGQTLATMKVVDVVTGGVDVTVTLDSPATLFASTGGKHITIAWNLDKAEGAVTGFDTSLFTLETGTQAGVPGCNGGCGDFAFTGLQGTGWNGTSPPAPAGPITFHIAGITTADFVNNSAGFMGAVDLLATKTGEVGGTGTAVSTPEPSTWAMMLIGFAGLAFAGYRKAKSARTAFA